MTENRALLSVTFSVFISLFLPFLAWILSKNSGQKYGFFESITDWRGDLCLWYDSDTRRQKFQWKSRKHPIQINWAHKNTDKSYTDQF